MALEAAIHDPELQLRELVARHPLPGGWQAPKLFAERVEVVDTPLYLVGLVSAREDGVDVTGSAAEDWAVPVARAYYELLERTTLLDAIRQVDRRWVVADEDAAAMGTIAAPALFPPDPEPALWRHARSNGVALSTSWSDACRRAGHELAERDLLLRGWYGRLSPRPLDPPARLIPEGWRRAYEFAACVVGDGELSAVMIAGFPLEHGSPLIFGSAADASTDRELGGAWRECVQRLAFLWGEAIPSQTPAFSPSADYHQEYFLYPPNHARLHRWMLEGHSPAHAPPAKSPCPRGPNGFVSLGDRHDGLWIARCTRPVDFPLTFGHGHPNVRLDPASPLAIHPIA